MAGHYTPFAVPISCKGIVFEDGQVWLRKNERDEWELPGGKLDPGEQPKDAVAREMREELGLEVEVGRITSAYLYSVQASLDETRGVLVISYPCKLIKRLGDVEHEGEAGPAEFEKFALDAIPELNMPGFYKDAIAATFGNNKADPKTDC